MCYAFLQVNARLLPGNARNIPPPPPHPPQTNKQSQHSQRAFILLMHPALLNKGGGEAGGGVERVREKEDLAAQSKRRDVGNWIAG